jgi:hypothetical protein
MRSALPAVITVLAYLVIGCGTSGPQAVPTPDTTATSEPRTPEPDDVLPTSAATLVPRAPAAQLSINPQPAPQSGQVRVAGKGFAPGESVTVSVAKTADAASGAVPLANALASGDGDFAPVTLSLPDELLSGPHTIDAVGQSSGRRSTGTLWIRAPQPWLVVDSYDVPQYGDLGLIAGGFEPMDQVQVSLEPAEAANGVPVALLTLTTDQAGNAAWAQLKLPRLSAGTYSIVLRGQADQAELRRDLHVTPLKPIVELSPWAGPPGIPVQLNAKGFAASERIAISFGASHAENPTVLQADEYGNLWGAGPVRIPQTAPPGAFALNLVGEDSGATASPEFKVLDPKPWLELTAWSGAPGAPVGFGGGGWIAGERVGIHSANASTPELTTGVADDNGWLKGADQVYIPNEVDDDVIFVAVGDHSHLVAAATFKVVFPFGLRPGQPQVPQVSLPKSGD